MKMVFWEKTEILVNGFCALGERKTKIWLGTGLFCLFLFFCFSKDA